METGNVVQIVNLAKGQFGEGMVILEDEVRVANFCARTATLHCWLGRYDKTSRLTVHPRVDPVYGGLHPHAVKAMPWWTAYRS